MKYKTHKNTKYTIIKNTSEVNKQHMMTTMYSKCFYQGEGGLFPEWGTFIVPFFSPAFIPLHRIK